MLDFDDDDGGELMARQNFRVVSAKTQSDANGVVRSYIWDSPPVMVTPPTIRIS